MARKRHAFHCQHCGSECTIYKKGRRHKVLVCPQCGVLATNPFSFKGLVKGALGGAAAGSVVPGWGTAIGAGVGALTGAFSGKKTSTTEAPTSLPATHLSSFEKALLVEQLERHHHGS